MQFISTLLALGAVALPSVAAAALPSQVFDSISSVPRGWSHHRNPESGEQVTLRVSLREQNLDKLEKMFWEMSDPEHENYGNHLENHALSDLVKPAEETVNAVLGWLKSHSIDRVKVEDSWVHFTTTVGNANKMLGTDFNWYKNGNNEAYLRTTEYSVPSHIVKHINHLSPTLKFPSLKSFRSNIKKVGDVSAAAAYMELTSVATNGLDAISNTTCNQAITPQCLLNLYNVHYAAKNNSKLAFASFLNESARFTDLTEFETAIAPYASGKTFTITSFNNGTTSQTSTDDSVEANLDCQYVTGVGYPLNIIEYSTGGCGPLIPDPNEPAGACDNEPYSQFLSGLLALPSSSLPTTLSISYGEDEQTWPLAQAKSVCNQFMQLGSRGVSVLIASGDSGPGAICENNDGSKAQFVPNFPASCPYLTTVGATYHIPEQAVSFSGGGFSNYFARPSYQNSAVKAYLTKLGTQFKGYYNASGRGYPDVSAQGVNFLVVDKGATEPVDGTSASTPAFSSVIALLNSARIASGLKPLGFLNTFLYGQGLSGLTDITSGSSTGCSSGNKPIANAGFAAVSGWDASTGLGTPNFGKLLAIAAPKQCNVGGVVANPTQTACPTATKA